ncbi:hypothetical protein [Mycolicibacterium tokaiense]|uniref:hypothetical protein n=1 Tax=Mycolicibacterium tokaiense TaxID=39695 RepID=UPI000E1C087C|nr:hypothetical protein [Mycolicibacterium tokaiense]
MRMVVVVAASVLVAGCSTGSQEASTPNADTSSPASTALTPRSSAPSSVPAGPPPAGAPVTAVISWVQAGPAADPGGFRSATRDDTVTDLGDDVAFVTPSGTTQCRTAADVFDGAMACLVELTDPPPPPAEVYGQWVGNWVDFDGAAAQIGSVHGDPGPFSEGTGSELPYGSSLRFGDYQCRTDPVALFCVNFARQTALQMSDAGVVPFGCLQNVTTPADVGIRYECR